MLTKGAGALCVFLAANQKSSLGALRPYKSLPAHDGEDDEEIKVCINMRGLTACGIIFEKYNASGEEGRRCI